MVGPTVRSSCSIVRTTFLNLMAKYWCLLQRMSMFIDFLSTPLCTIADLIRRIAVQENSPVPASKWWSHVFFLLNKLNVDTYGSICLSFGWWRCSYGLSFKVILTKHRATDLLRFHLVLSTALYFNGFYWLFNAVHDQAFNEKPLTNVLLWVWKQRAIS